MRKNLNEKVSIRKRQIAAAGAKEMHVYTDTSFVCV